MGAPIFSTSRVDTDTTAAIIVALFFFFSVSLCYGLSLCLAWLVLSPRRSSSSLCALHETLTPVVVEPAQCNARRRVESSSRRHASSSYWAPSRFSCFYSLVYISVYIQAPTPCAQAAWRLCLWWIRSAERRDLLPSPPAIAPRFTECDRRCLRRAAQQTAVEFAEKAYIAVGRCRSNVLKVGYRAHSAVPCFGSPSGRAV